MGWTPEQPTLDLMKTVVLHALVVGSPMLVLLLGLMAGPRWIRAGRTLTRLGPPPHLTRRAFQSTITTPIPLPVDPD